MIKRINLQSPTLSQELAESFIDTGFAIITNHGIPSKHIETAYSFAEQFFKLPLKVKKKYELPQSNGQVGYTAFGKEHAKYSETPDLKEFFHITNMAKNVYPSEVANFDSFYAYFTDQLDEIAWILLKACEESTQVEGLKASTYKGPSVLRLLHYPPLKDAAINGERAAAHEDINLITLLPAATNSGLQILTTAGEWVEVITKPNELIVSVGDMLQNITNGLFKSTTHKVVNPTDDSISRYSMPYFVHPESNFDLTPQVKGVKIVSSKFSSITAGQYLSQRLKEIGLKK